MTFLLAMLASAVPAYILGGINGAIITSILIYRKDIRKFGSGNPGLTNFYRVFGKGGAVLVVAVDTAKTVAPVIFGGWLFKHFYDMALFGQAFAGFFVVLGHCFPVFYEFKGGKGVMALGVIFIILDWRIAIISWGAFIIITALTRYVSLAAMIGAAVYPPFMLIFKTGGFREVIIVVICAVLLIARHNANINRLIRGVESKFSFRGD